MFTGVLPAPALLHIPSHATTPVLWYCSLWVTEIYCVGITRQQQHSPISFRGVEIRQYHNHTCQSLPISRRRSSIVTSKSPVRPLVEVSTRRKAIGLLNLARPRRAAKCGSKTRPIIHLDSNDFDPSPTSAASGPQLECSFGRCGTQQTNTRQQWFAMAPDGLLMEEEVGRSCATLLAFESHIMYFSL